MAFRILAFGFLLLCCCGDEQTDITQKLNGMIAAKEGAIYGGGKGVMIRNLNDGLTTDASKQVVPATFLVNDIVTASIAYPTGNPMCPNNGWNGYSHVESCTEDPWIKGTVLIVIGSSMNVLFKDFDNIQNKDWGWGVFYGTDSNSVDKRCRWLEKYNGWDCPGYWLDANGNLSPDGSKMGAGSYDWGSPSAMLPGGGAGCHFNADGHAGVDQFDSDNEPNLVSNRDCECNYNLNGNGWQDWVHQWINHGKAKSDFSWMGWFAGGTKKAPSWAVDVSMCWVNNPRDMIYIQNMVWFHRLDWSNQLIPKSDWSVNEPANQRYYWGWNEVPVQSQDVNNPNNWDSIVIKLPAAICQGSGGGTDSIHCLSDESQHDIDNQLDWMESKGYLKVGAENIPNRPGSYVVLLREWQQSENHWQRWFFCENRDAGKYKVVSKAQSGDFPGECYVDYGGAQFLTV